MKNLKTTKSLSSFAGASLNTAAMKQVVGGCNSRGGWAAFFDCISRQN